MRIPTCLLINTVSKRKKQKAKSSDDNQIRYGVIRPPHAPEESPLPGAKPPRTAESWDLRNDLIDMAAYTKAVSGRLECDSIDETLRGQIGDRGTKDSDEVRKRREKLSQRLAAKRACALEAKSPQFDAATVRSGISDNVEKILRKEVLGSEAAARLEARFAEQERLKAEAAGGREKMRGQKKDMGSAVPRMLLGEAFDWSMANPEEQSHQRADGGTGASAEAQCRHPQRISAEEKKAARRGAKRSKSRDVGLIIGERRSWTENKGKERESGHKKYRSIPIPRYQDLHPDAPGTGYCEGGNRGAHTVGKQETKLESQTAHRHMLSVRKHEEEEKSENIYGKLMTISKFRNLHPNVQSTHFCDGPCHHKPWCSKRSKIRRHKSEGSRTPLCLERDEEPRAGEAKKVEFSGEATPIKPRIPRRHDRSHPRLAVSLREPSKKHPSPHTGLQVVKVTNSHKPPRQLFHTEAIAGISTVISLILLCNSVSWASAFWTLRREMSLMPSTLIVAGCILQDLAHLYRKRHHFWYSEEPEVFATAVASHQTSSYFAWIILMSWCGGFGAAAAVWLVPIVDRVLSRVYQKFSWYQGPKIHMVEGPFPEKDAGNYRSVRVRSFDINLGYAYILNLWNRATEALGYVLIYLALFSQDSWLSKLLALTAAIFIRSSFCPQPEAVQKGRTVQQLIRRERQFAMSVSNVSCPSFKECFEQLSRTSDQITRNFSEEARRLDYPIWLTNVGFMFRTDYDLMFLDRMLWAVGLILSLRDRHVPWILLASMALGIQLANHRLSLR